MYRCTHFKCNLNFYLRQNKWQDIQIQYSFLRSASNNKDRNIGNSYDSIDRMGIRGHLYYLHTIDQGLYTQEICREYNLYQITYILAKSYINQVEKLNIQIKTVGLDLHHSSNLTLQEYNNRYHNRSTLRQHIHMLRNNSFRGINTNLQNLMHIYAI